MSGTLRDLLFWSRIRCFACKNHRWGLGPTGTCYSDARHTVLHTENHRWGLGPLDTSNCGHKIAVLNAQNHRWGLEPIEPSNSGANHAVVHAQNERSCLGPIETCYSGPEFAVLQAKTTGWVLDPQRLVILVLKSLFCMHKTTGDGWNQYSLCVKHAVMCAQNHRWGLGHIETWNSGPNHAVFMHITTGYVLNS